MNAGERILTYVAFTWDKPFARIFVRFWEVAMDVNYHLVLTNRRLVVVRVSNPFDSSLIGGPLINAVFYNQRLKNWMAAVLKGDLDAALTTSLRKEIFPLRDLRSVSYEKGRDRRDTGSLVIELNSGRKRAFRLSSNFGHPITSMGGAFPFKANFSAAVREFNRLLASPAEPE